ncbi:MAG: ABC transporter ATP-binding protein [Holophagae bacterium]|nr:ABC transporter ATP-binding protein [Holophagae bacterium]
MNNNSSLNAGNMEKADAPLFQLENVGLVKGETRILSDISLEVRQGECLVLAGENGSGKTSLLRLFNRLDDPTEGTVRFHGVSLKDMDVRQIRSRVGIVMQGPVLFDGSVRDVLTRIRIVLKEDWEIEDVLNVSGLPMETLNRKTSDLSGGEVQLISIGIVALRNLEVLLLDEPAAALSVTAIDRLEKLLCRLQGEGRTLIQVTHQVDRMANMANRGIFMERGRATVSGSMADVIAAFGRG